MTKGKMSKHTSSAAQKKKTLMHTYITSLLSLILCVTMLFGTTAAWFTDTVETNQNQMYVGTLAVKLHHASYQNGNLENYTDVESQDYKVLDSSIKWEPGYTAVEKFKLTEEGSLAFGYKLNISVGETTGLTAEQFEVLTKAITVWNYIGSDAANYEIPESFNELSNDPNWEPIGTLFDVITKKLTVFSGSMDSATVTAKDTTGSDVPGVSEHIIALHMDESFDGVVNVANETEKTVQGKTLSGIQITLVATQLPSENDAFGSDYDKTIEVAEPEKFADALKDAEDGAVLSLEAGTYTMPSVSGSKAFTITGTKDTVLDVTKGAYMDNANVTIEGVTIKTSTGYVMDENGNKGSDYAALYSPNTTYVNCTFVGPMRVGRDGAKFVNCTFTQLGNDYIWTYGNDVTFEGCTFNTDGKAILIYSDGGSEVSQVSVKNCVFNSTQGAKAGAIANQNCAAIEIHNYGNGVNLTTSGNTYDSNFSGEWRIKTYENGKPEIIVNGTKYTTIAIDGKTMTIDENKNVTVID